MDLLAYYLKETNDQERKRLKKVRSKKNRRVTKINTTNFARVILVWAVGGVVSLIPSVLYMFCKEDISSISQLQTLFFELFSNKDSFLVFTTLTITAFLELAFAEENRNLKYIISCLEIVMIIMCCSITILLQFGIDIPASSYIGLFMFFLCIVLSLGGYYLVCKEKDE